MHTEDQPASGYQDGQDAPPARSASEDGRGGAAALRLEKRIHLDNGRYRINLRNYGNGLAEIGWSFAANLRPGKVGRGLSEDREEHENRAVRHARSRVRHLILAARADHLLTLTYRDNVTDFDRACADLSKFVRIVKPDFDTSEAQFWPPPSNGAGLRALSRQTPRYMDCCFS